MENTGFGFVSDNDESLEAKSSGGKFGLNVGTFTKLGYNPNAGKGGTPGDAFDIVVSIAGREYSRRLFDITGGLYGRNGMVQPNEEGYSALYTAALNQLIAVATHAVKTTGVTEDQIAKAMEAKPADFVAWAKIMTSLVNPATLAAPIDIFLQYQWEPKGDNTRTFLELPKNMKDRYFLCPSVKPVGKWKEVRDAKGLHYVDDSGAEHPFRKSANFMENPKANMIDLEAKEGAAPAFGGATTTPPATGGW